MNEAIKTNRLTPVVDTMAADLLTPLAVYLKLSAKSDHSFLLESVEGGKTLARYSFIGADPVEVVTGGRESYEHLRKHFAHNTASHEHDMPPFIGGAIGYLGFDACEWFEGSLAREGVADEACSFMFYRSVVAFDHARQVIKIVSLDLDDDQHGALYIIRFRQDLVIVIEKVESLCQAEGVFSENSRLVSVRRLLDSFFDARG